MSKRTPGFERRDRDFYPTPAKAVLPLIPHLRAARVRRFAEPCCGDGALVRHLEAQGLTCTYAGDVATGQDALAIPSFDSPVITNPPFSRQSRKMLLALLEHFLAVAPFQWLLLPNDWTTNQYARPYMAHATDVVSIGRVRWIPGTPNQGMENFSWIRFAREHATGPIQHPRGAVPMRVRTMTCASCGRSFVPTRTDARHCSHACRQRAYRERLAVT